MNKIPNKVKLITINWLGYFLFTVTGIAIIIFICSACNTRSEPTILDTVLPISVEYIAIPSTFGGDLLRTIIKTEDGRVLIFPGNFSVSLGKINKICVRNGFRTYAVVVN